jgi:hypothetical protein
LLKKFLPGEGFFCSGSVFEGLDPEVLEAPLPLPFP